MVVLISYNFQHSETVSWLKHNCQIFLASALMLLIIRFFSETIQLSFLESQFIDTFCDGHQLQNFAYFINLHTKNRDTIARHIAIFHFKQSSDFWWRKNLEIQVTSLWKPSVRQTPTLHCARFLIGDMKHLNGFRNVHGYTLSFINLGNVFTEIRYHHFYIWKKWYSII